MDASPLPPHDQTRLRETKPGGLPTQLMLPDDPLPMGYAGPGDDELPLPVSAVRGEDLPDGTVTGA